MIYCGLTRELWSEHNDLQLKCAASEVVSSCLLEVFKLVASVRMHQRESLGVHGSFFNVSNLFSALTTCSLGCNCSQLVPCILQDVECAVTVVELKQWSALRNNILSVKGFQAHY